MTRSSAAGTAGGGRGSRPPRAGLLAIVGTLLAVAAALAVFLASAPAALPRAFAYSAVVSLCVGLPVWAGWRYLVPRIVGARPTALTLALAGGGVIVVGVGAGALASRFLLRALGLPVGPGFLGTVVRIGLVVSVAVSAVLVVAHRLLAEAHARSLEAEEARRREVEARLEALRARTNPHFLFNALNTIAGLVHEDPEAAEQAVEQLAALLRFTLEAGRAERVALGDELAVVRRYLELERARLGDRLRAEIDVEDGLDTLAVPPLVLLPLVENAVRHGIAPRAGGGRVRIAARRDDGTLALVVEDDGPGPGGSAAGGTGTSLADLRARVTLLGGVLETGPAGEKGFRAVVRLPVDRKEDPR